MRLGLRLVRSNCPDCCVPYEPEASLLRMVSAEEMESAMFRRGQGCSACLGTGYSGRNAVSELLEVNEVMRDAILQKLPTRSLQEVASQQGMSTLWQNGIRRALRGESPLEEIVRVMAADAG